VHSRRKSDSLLASALLATVNYMWWQLGHLAHHVNVRSPGISKSTCFQLLLTFALQACIHGVLPSQQTACLSPYSTSGMDIQTVCPLQNMSASWYTCKPATLDCRWASLTTRRPRGAGRLCTSLCHAASWGTCKTVRRPSSSACAPATSPPGAPAAGAQIAAASYCSGGVRILAWY
jgi:hypothetical protein